MNVPPASAAPGPCASPGADGPQPTLGGTVNTYFPGISTSVAAGATSLDLGAGIGATTPIAAGDKLLIIQMQAADLDTTNTDAYGDGIAGEPPSGATDWGSAGTYELAVAANSVSTVGGTLQLSAGTHNAYATAAATATSGRQAFQVVRVPQFSSATLGSNVTAAPWNGSAGGIVALDVAGTLDLNGFRIDVSASGFRGGAGRTTRRRRRRREHRCSHVRCERLQRRQSRRGCRYAAIRVRRYGHDRHRCRGLPERQFCAWRTRKRGWRWQRRESVGE